MSDAVRNTNTLNDTPSGERVHIGFFGIRNAGKSSVVNAVTNQELPAADIPPQPTCWCHRHPNGRWDRRSVPL